MRAIAGGPLLVDPWGCYSNSWHDLVAQLHELIGDQAIRGR